MTKQKARRAKVIRNKQHNTIYQEQVTPDVDMELFLEFCSDLFCARTYFGANGTTIMTDWSSWRVKQENGFFVLYHKPAIAKRYHYQTRSKDLSYLLFYGCAHDFYKYNKLPYISQEDYKRVLKDYDRFLKHEGVKDNAWSY